MEQGVKLEARVPKSYPDIARNLKWLLNLMTMNRFECTSRDVLNSILLHLTFLKCIMLSDRLQLMYPPSCGLLSAVLKQSSTTGRHHRSQWIFIIRFP